MVALDTTGTTVVVRNPARKAVATIGVQGLAIIDTGDALLVVPKELSGKVKDLVDALKNSDRHGDLV